MRPPLKCVASALSNRFIQFDRRNPSVRGDEFGEDGRVIAGAAAEMHHCLAGPHVQFIEEMGPETGLSVIDALGFIDGDEHVVIDVPRVRILGRPEALPPQNPPRTGTDEVLARHRSERGEEGARRHVGDEAQLFRIVESRGFKRLCHRPSNSRQRLTSAITRRPNLVAVIDPLQACRRAGARCRAGSHPAIQAAAAPAEIPESRPAVRIGKWPETRPR